MSEIVDAITHTCMKFANDHLRWIAVGILAFVGAGVALRVLSVILPRGGPKQGK